MLLWLYYRNFFFTWVLQPKCPNKNLLLSLIDNENGYYNNKNSRYPDCSVLTKGYC